jgi:hypothetical protein
MIAAASASADFHGAVYSAKPCRMAKVAHPVGMRDSHVRTDFRAGDIAG